MSNDVKHCTCCDLPEEMCGRQAQRRQEAEVRAERARLLARPGWFLSQYRGVCKSCGTPYPAGTPIGRVGGGLYPSWKAECCA